MRRLDPMQYVEWQSQMASFCAQLHYAMRRAQDEVLDQPQPTDAEEAAILAAILEVG